MWGAKAVGRYVSAFGSKIARICESVGLKKKPRRLFNFITRMEEKDPELLKSIGPLPILDGVMRWKEKYPEDFPELDKHQPEKEC